MRAAEVGPIGSEGFLLDLLRNGRSRLDNGRKTLAGAIALQLRLVRYSILKCREWPHTASVKLEPEPEKQHQPSDAPAGDQDRAGQFSPHPHAGPQP